MKRPRQGVMRNQISKIIVKGGKNHWLKHTRTQPTSRTCYSSTAVKCWHCRGLSRTRRDLYKRWLDPRSWGLNIIQQSHKVLAIYFYIFSYSFHYAMYFKHKSDCPRYFATTVSANWKQVIPPFFYCLSKTNELHCSLSSFLIVL